MRRVSPVLLLVALFLLVRLIYAKLLDPRVLFLDLREEAYRGTIALEVIRGLKIPFFEYAADSYSGGSLVEGVLAVPFFLVFGPTLFALRCVPLFFSLGTMLGWYYLLRRFFNPRAAVLTSLFFALPPPTHLVFTSMAMGFHTESTLFSVVAFLCLFEIIYGKKEGLRWPALLGLVLGFGVWFVYTTLISVAIVIGWWFWRDHKLLVRRSFWTFAGFFVLGFFPWFLHNLTQRFGGLELLRIGLVYDYLHGLPSIIMRLARIVLEVVPMLFTTRIMPDTFTPWVVIATGIFAMSMAGLLLRAWRERSRSISPPAIVFPFFASCFYVLIVSATQFGYASTYLLPILPYLFAGLGLWLSSAWDKSARGRLQVYLIAGLWVAAGVLGLRSLMSFEWPPAILRMPGYGYEGLADALYNRHQLHVHHLIPLIQTLNARLPEEDLKAFSEALALDWPTPIGEAEVPKLCELIPYLREKDRPLLCYRLGIAIGLFFRGSAEDPIEEIEKHVPLELRHWTKRGVELVGLYPPSQLVNDDINRLPLRNAGGDELFFLDRGTYPSDDDSFWVVGGETAKLLYTSSLPVKGLSVTLVNGEKLNRITIKAGDELRVFEMHSRQTVLAAIPLNHARRSKGRYVSDVAIQSQGGYFPILISESNDSRYLGVKVKSELVLRGD